MAQVPLDQNQYRIMQAQVNGNFSKNGENRILKELRNYRRDMQGRSYVFESEGGGAPKRIPVLSKFRGP